MPEAPPRKRRATLTGKRIAEHLNQQVKVFLINGKALDGVLLDYFYDTVERDGVITLSAKQPGGEPSIVFKKDVSMIQPVNPAPPKTKGP